MKTHLRHSKNMSTPACAPYGTARNTLAADPKWFFNAPDKCKRCEAIFEKRREAQRKSKA